MVRHLADETLRTGERLQILLVEPPDAAAMPGVVDLLGHKGSHWQMHFQAAIAGETGRLETRFYVGMLGGLPVSNVMTVECDGRGILGHVFTRPEHRRKGIYNLVMARQMADFSAREGHVMVLGTGFESHAYWIYHSFGFRSLSGGFMRYEAPGYAAYAHSLFAPGAVTAAPLRWEDWPRLAHLASIPGSDTLRSVAWHMDGICNLEFAVCAFFHDYPNGGASASVLHSETGGVVGCATRFPLRLGEERKPWAGAWQVDAFTHPHFDGSVAAALDALEPAPGKHIAFVEAGAAARCAGFEAAGFRPEAALTGLFRFEAEAADITVYTKDVD